MSVKEINLERSKSNYQVFKFKDDGTMYGIVGRIPDKLKAYGDLFPKDMTDKIFLDVGCDFGFWCFEATQRGAAVLGLDRGRNEKDGTHYNIVEMNQRVVKQFPEKYGWCDFESINLGKEWKKFGSFDIVMCCSMYHHIYAQCGDHDTIMEWLSSHCWPSSCKSDKPGYVIWENPINLKDGVANQHIPQEYKANYTQEKILESANKFFDSVEHIGSAMHVKTRQVYKMVVK